MATEARGQPLQAAVAAIDLDTIDWDLVFRGHAQTFKTVRPSPPIWAP
jgi:hypothetical protein